MNRIKNLFKYIFVFALALFFVDNVYATSNISVGVRAVTPGKKICASSNVFGNAHLYGWDYNSDQPISVWPGEAMTKNDDNFYCYTVQNGKTFNMVLFNNDYDAQTINLSTIMDDSDLINDYLYIFNTPYDGKYIGEWYVYDTSGLTTLVNSTTNKVEKRLKYTKRTYNTLKTEYDNSNEIINYDNPYGSTDTPLVIHKNDSSEGVVYTSRYVDAYNGLTNAVEGLKDRIPIVVNDDLITGELSASYTDEAEQSNYIISINAEPITGYDVSEVTAHAITGYNGTEPVLGNEIPVTSSDGHYYAEFDEEFASNIKGVYVNADFIKKTYKIKFKIDKNGKVIYIKDGQEIDLYGLVSIEHSGNLLAKIVANEGYVLKSAMVNGTSASVRNNTLNIEDIGADQEVELFFTLKSYTVSVDDVDYIFVHGTTYDQIVAMLNPHKDGYTFVGLVDKNRERLSKDYKVVGNDTLYTLFRNDDEIINPETGLNVLKVIIIFIFVITLLYINGKSIEKNKKKRLNK